MPRVKKLDLGMTALDELFMNDKERAENKLPKIFDIPLSEIDDIVPVTVSTPCLLRYALVGGFHADNAILIARVIEDRPVISPDIPHGSPLLSRFLSVHRFSLAPSFLPFMPPRHICALHRSGGFPIPSHNPRKYRDVVLSAVSALPCRCRAFS